MNRTRLIVIILSVFLIAGCQIWNKIFPSKPKSNIPPFSDFKSFPSAQSFNQPGRIFRVTPNGVVYGVTVLSITPHEGNEVIPKMIVKSSLSLKEILKTMGVAAEQLPANVNFEVSKKRDVELESVEGKRQWLDDVELDKTLPVALKGITIRPDNKYFIIRETISTKNIKYTMGKAWIITLGFEAQFKTMVENKTNLDWSSEKTFSMDKTFDQPLRVWYKDEQIKIVKPFGVGPGQLPKVTRMKEIKTTGFRLPETIIMMP